MRVYTPIDKHTMQKKSGNVHNMLTQEINKTNILRRTYQTFSSFDFRLVQQYNYAGSNQKHIITLSNLQHCCILYQIPRSRNRFYNIIWSQKFVMYNFVKALCTFRFVFAYLQIFVKITSDRKQFYHTRTPQSILL